MSSDFYKKILDNNKKWVEDQLNIDPEYFKEYNKETEVQIVKNRSPTLSKP